VLSSNGLIDIRDIGGGADLSGRFGRIDAQMVKRGLRVTAANSDVRAADVDGPAYVKTSFGQVNAERIRGPLEVDNSNGSVQAMTVIGAASVSTSFAPVVLKDVEGRIDVRNSNGGIDVTSVPRQHACHDVALTSSFGGITAALPDVGYTVTARTSFGKIRSDLPVTMSEILNGGAAISGTIRGGGCQLTITNSNGDIQIVRAR
jgi:DUF4097 and DUF4098 domain-containing protein YvlB